MNPALDEYRAAREGIAFADLADRALVRVAGADRADFLHRILSSDVRGLALGFAQESFLLESRGKIVAPLVVRAEADAFLLECGRSLANRIAEALEAFHFAEAVSIEDASAEFSATLVLGPKGEGALAAADTPKPGFVARANAWRVPGLVAWRVSRDAASLLESLATVPGARRIGEAALEMLRLEAGTPRFGVDFDGSNYPVEAGLESAVSLTKGCFVGQEVAAKLQTYGGWKKRLALLHVEGETGPAAGDRVERDGGEVGAVTSSAPSPRLGGFLSFAMLRKGGESAGTLVAVVREDRRLPAEVVPAPAVEEA